MEEHKMYRLYALLTNEQNIQYASKQRFHRITPCYVLVFTNTDMPADSIEISADEADNLTPYDVSWLRDCTLAVALEAIQSEDTAQKTMNMLDKIEQALQTQAEQISED